MVRDKGERHTPHMCRECYLREMRSPDGRLRQAALTQAAKMRAARAPAKVAPPRMQVPDIDPLLLPQGTLWFERERVFAFIEEKVGESARAELGKHKEMEDRWDSWRSRPWLRFDQVDELLCVLGLWVGDLGEPIYSGSEKRYPVLVAA